MTRDQLLAFIGDNDSGLLRAKVLAKVQGPLDENEDKAIRNVAFFIELAILEGKVGKP